MPNCVLRLSEYSPAERLISSSFTRNDAEEDEKEGKEKDINWVDFFLPEEPQGTYHNLVDNKTYYIHVFQDAEQLEIDQMQMRSKAADMKRDVKEVLVKEDGRGFESCSCIYGEPCRDEYGCRDWGNRFTIAKSNGWKDDVND